MQLLSQGTMKVGGPGPSVTSDLKFKRQRLAMPLSPCTCSEGSKDAVKQHHGCFHLVLGQVVLVAAVAAKGIRLTSDESATTSGPGMTPAGDFQRGLLIPSAKALAAWPWTCTARPRRHLALLGTSPCEGGWACPRRARFSVPSTSQGAADKNPRAHIPLQAGQSLGSSIMSMMCLEVTLHSLHSLQQHCTSR